MARKPIPPDHSSAAETHAKSDPWASDDWIASWMGVRWMNFGLQAWTAWLEQCSAALKPQRDDADSTADDRRCAGLPWLPRIESTVVPLRRRGDQPGAAAEKLSLRIQVPPLPWEQGGGSVIAIDSLRPRSAEPAGGTGKNSPARH